MTVDRSPSFSRFIPLILGIAAVCLGWMMAASLLAENDWNPSVFIKFPEAKPTELAYGEAMLGDVIPSGGFGHDGKFYFMQAMDPFFLSPEDHAAYLDRPTVIALNAWYIRHWPAGLACYRPRRSLGVSSSSTLWPLESEPG